MANARIDKLKDLLQKKPGDSMTRYMLANELYKDGQYEDAVEQMETYLEAETDEGAAYRTLADAYLQLGRTKEARWALRQGAIAARAHHHEGMAEELEDRLKELG